MKELRESGAKNIQPYKSIEPNHVFTFSYTSGTTGNPKGAMISHINMVSLLAAMKANPDINTNENDVYLSYLPLPHLFDRLMLCTFLYNGGHIYFYGGDVLKLK